jgi:AraC-like DNA-binding protein
MPILPGERFRRLSRRRFRFHYRLPAHGLPFLAEVHLRPERRLPLHTHAGWQCLIPLHPLRYRLTDDERIASAGELLRFPPALPHALTDNGQACVVFLDIRIDPDSALASCIAGLPRQRLLVAPTVRRACTSAWSRCAGLPAPHRSIRIMAQLWRLLDGVHADENPNQDTPPPTDSLDPRLAALDDLLRYCPQDHITVADMAAHVGLSASQLSRLARHHLGVSPLQRLLHWRIERARELLLTRETIDTVAHQCGFGSVDHFRRCFRRHTGVLPGEWRRHQGLSPDA